ncbi:MAG: GGDEF domain-containing protein [Pseudomonadota bacterium]
MFFRIRTIWDVRVFSVALTGFVLLASVVLQALILPSELAQQVRWPGVVITFMLAAPMIYVSGLRLYDSQILNKDRLDVAQRDALTGLLTRPAFVEKIRDIGSLPGVMVMADIDNFKSYNDEHGHAMGDAALVQVAQTFLRHCRAEDLVARYGGEEFMIFLPDTNREEGIAVAERLRQKLAGASMEHGGKTLRITASFGVAMLEHEDSIEETIAQADAALYRSKHQGRNSVCAAA